MLIAPVVVLIVIVVLGFVGIRKWVFAHQEQSDAVAGPEVPTLEYLVPSGQDPVVLLTVLRQEGYEATTDPRTPTLVHIACPAGLDRERARVRATIESAGVTAVDTGQPFRPGEVRFVDER